MLLGRRHAISKIIGFFAALSAVSVLFFGIGVPILFSVMYGAMRGDGGTDVVIFVLGSLAAVFIALGFVFFKPLEQPRAR